jgi:hypothetical protein
MLLGIELVGNDAFKADVATPHHRLQRFAFRRIGNLLSFWGHGVPPWVVSNERDFYLMLSACAGESRWEYGEVFVACQ